MKRHVIGVARIEAEPGQDEALPHASQETCRRQEMLADKKPLQLVEK